MMPCGKFAAIKGNGIPMRVFFYSKGFLTPALFFETRKATVYKTQNGTTEDEGGSSGFESRQKSSIFRVQ
jgi:hypothetical protein